MSRTVFRPVGALDELSDGDRVSINQSQVWHRVAAVRDAPEDWQAAGIVALADLERHVGNPLDPTVFTTRIAETALGRFHRIYRDEDGSDVIAAEISLYRET